MFLAAIFKRNGYDLDRTLTDLLDRDASQNLTDQTAAGDISKVVSYRLDYLQNLPSASTDSVQKEMAFLYGEYDTWSLLNSIQRSSSPLQKSSNIRDWVNGVLIDQHIPDAVLKDTMEEEVDAEIDAMLNFSIKSPTTSTDNTPINNRKRTIDSDGDDTLSKDGLDRNGIQRQRTTKDDQLILERNHESIYKHLRKDDMDGAIQFCTEHCEPWFTAVIKTHVQQCKRIKAGHSIELESEQLKHWRITCESRLKKGTFGPYGKAVYGLLLGDIDIILPVCASWEDVIWAYYSTQMELTLGKLVEASNTTNDVSRLDQDHVEIAIGKDSDLPRKHPKHFFHLIQAHILSQNTEKLFQLAHKNPDDGLYSKAFIIRNDPDIRHQMDRFLAALAVYAKLYLNSPSDDPNSDQIIYHYAKRNQCPPTFYPTVLAFYASQINEELGSELFAEFLIGFYDDDQERRLLIEVASQYKLDVRSILRRTYNIARTHTRTKDPKEQISEPQINYSNDYGLGVFELIGPKPDEVPEFHQALEWLLLDESLYSDAIQQVNREIRKYLGKRQIYLAENMIQAIPIQVTDKCLLQTQGGFKLPHYLEEIQDHALLLETWKLFSAWDSLQKAKPSVTSDTLETLKRTMAWERGFMELTEKLENRLLGFLNSSWLKDDNGSVSKGTDDALRQIYISDAVLRLHHIQYCTKDLGDRNYSVKKNSLIQLVASEKNKIYKDIVGCGKMVFIFKTINEQ